MDRFVKPRADKLRYIGWAIVVVFLLVIALDSLVGMPGRDSGVFIYVGQGLLDGEIPYLDRWDHKGPLTYVLNAAGWLVGGVPGIWLLGALFLVGSAWLAFRMTKEAFGATAALGSLAIFLIFFPRFAQGGNVTEHYALLFQFSTLLLFLQIEQRRKSNDIWPALAIGMLGAGAFLLRPNLIGVWLAIGLYWMIRRGNALRWTAWSIVGGLSALLIVSITFALFGGWGALWDATIAYNFAYLESSLKDRLRMLLDLRRDLVFLSLPLAASWCIGFHYWLKGKARSGTFEHILPLALILGPVEAVLISLSGNHYGHYYLAILPVASVLIAFLIRFLTDQRLVAPVVLLAALLVAVLYYQVSYGHAARMVDKYTRIDEIITSSKHHLVASRVQEETAPDDLILLWGAESQIYWLSHRDAPTRFFYQYPLVQPGYSSPAIRNEFISDVVSSRPAMIIDTRNERLPPLDRVERRSWRPDGDLRHPLQPFFDFVETEYEVIDEVSGYTLYGLRGRR